MQQALLLVEENMKKITKALLEVEHIEQLSNNCSIVHQLHPLFKIISALIFIICVLSTSYINIIELCFYFIIIFVVVKASHLSMISILSRTLIALPFSLCIGLSNLIFMQNTIWFCGIEIAAGILSFISILLKTTLSLSTIFILIATTGFEEVACELVHIKVPAIFVLQLLMTYRYIFLLVEEAQQMSKAYLLRNPGHKGIEMKDMGSFLGSLLIRSFHRSQDIYKCMITRGFDVKKAYVNYQYFAIENYFLLLMEIGFFIIVKVVFI